MVDVESGMEVEGVLVVRRSDKPREDPFYLELIDSIGKVNPWEDAVNRLGYYCDRVHLLSCYNEIGKALGFPRVDDKASPFAGLRIEVDPTLSPNTIAIVDCQSGRRTEIELNAV